MRFATIAMAVMLLGCSKKPCTQQHQCTCPCGATCTTSHDCNEFPACTCCDSACADASTDTDEEPDGCLISVGGSDLSPSALSYCGLLGPHCPTVFDDGCPTNITCPGQACSDTGASCSYCPLGIFYGDFIEATCESGVWTHTSVHCDTPITCATDEQCDDMNSCTEDRCHLGTCVHRDICDTEETPDAPEDVLDAPDASDIPIDEYDEPDSPDTAPDTVEDTYTPDTTPDISADTTSPDTVTSDPVEDDPGIPDTTPDIDDEGLDGMEL